MLTAPLRRILFWLTLVGALGYGVFHIISAYPWYGHPFPGFLMVKFQTVDTISYGHWNGAKAGVQPGDRIVRVDARRPDNSQWVRDYVKKKAIGTPIHYDIERPQFGKPGLPLSFEVPTQVYGLQDWLNYTLGSWLLGFLHLLVGMLVSLRRPGDRVAQAHWLFCLVMYLFFLESGARVTSSYELDVVVVEGLVGTAGMHLAMWFPRETPLVHSRLNAKLVLVVGLITTALIGVISWSEPLYWVSEVVAICMGSAGVVAVISNAVWTSLSRSSSGVERSRSRILAVGLTIGFLPTIVTIVWSIFGGGMGAMDWSYLAIAAFPIAIAYAILRHQLFDIQVVIRRSTLYALVVATLAGLYLAVSSLGYALIASLLPSADHVVSFVAAMTVAVAFQPVQSGLGQLLARWLWPHEQDPVVMLTVFSQELPMERTGVAQRLVETVRNGLHADWVGVQWGDDVLAAAGTAPRDWGEAVMSFASGRGRLWIGERDMLPSDVPRHDQGLQALLAQAETAMDSARLMEERIQLQVQQETAQRLAEAQERALREVVSEIKQEVRRMTEAVDACETGEVGPVAVIQKGVKRIEERLDERTDALLRPQA